LFRFRDWYRGNGIRPASLVLRLSRDLFDGSGFCDVIDDCIYCVVNQGRECKTNMTKKPGTLPGFFVSIDKRPVSIDKRPVSIDKRPVSIDKRPVSIDKRPVSIDKRYLHVGTIWELHLFR